MAWRLSRYQTFVANTTVVTAAFLNAVQDAILDLFNGNYTVKKFQADGTGDVACALNAGEIGAKCFIANGDHDDDPAIKSETLAGSDWKCLWQIKVGTSDYVRFYKGASAFVFTYNAVWNIGTDKWDQEDATLKSSCLMFALGNFYFQQKPASSASWSAYGWLDTGAVTASGTVRHYDTISSSTVGAGQAVTLGQQYLDTTPIAWAYVDSNGTLIRGANIKTCAETAPGSAVYDLELNNAPANAACAVGSIGETTANGGKINVIANAGSPEHVQVHTFNAAGTATSQRFSLVVFGG